MGNLQKMLQENLQKWGLRGGPHPSPPIDYCQDSVAPFLGPDQIETIILHCFYLKCIGWDFLVWNWYSNLCCFELCGQPQSAGDRSQTGVMGWKKGVGVGRETCFWNFVVFYRKNASPVPTPVQIEAIVSESVCFTNCFYLKRTRLHMDLGLLLFEKNIEYLLK